jgi:single-strand DNA-binding protein
MNFNKITIIGRMTRDPELKTTSSGQNVASFSVATNRDWKDKNNVKQSKTEFFNVVMWGKLAEISAQWLVKGQEVLIEGRMESRTYVGKDNVERTVWDLVADGMNMGNRPQARDDSDQTQRTAPTAQPQRTATPPVEEIPTINLDEESDDVRLEDVPF